MKNIIGSLTTFDHPRRQLVWLLITVSAVMLLASIGMTDFNTKGEPREVVVAHTMLSQGNWILPTDNAGDMAYKPPMFHWLVAISCWVFGSASEFACRLPSAIGLIALVAMTFSFFAPKSRDGSDCRFAMLTALLTLTSFECYRAGTNCRVDMVLTAFMCGGMMSLCKALRTRPLQFYFLGIVCMSGAALTKGPVGIILPLAVYWIYGLLSGRNFFFVSIVALLLLIGASILPGLYYYKAWLMGGDQFYRLVMEENFGRMAGTMTYESHVNPWWYNFTSLLLGWLPWTLLLLISAILAFSKRRRERSGAKQVIKRLRVRQFFRQLDSQQLFSIVAIVVILVFYTIPKSKRSVYLLPMYPFIAYWIAVYIKWLMRRFRLGVGTVAGIMVVVCVLYPIGYGIVYPLIINRHSDRGIALQINRIVPAGYNIYTFIPSRFMRFYITDHYLGYRMLPMLPSGQVAVSNDIPDANDIHKPEERVYYVALSSDVWEAPAAPLGQASYDKKSDYGFHAWLESEGLCADKVYESEHKTHDVKGRLVLLCVHPSDNNTDL